jgi:kynurenine formamidase
MAESALPSYDQLPTDPAMPARSAWGVFGSDDELGTLNLLTADRVLRASRLIRKGSVFPLNWSLEKPNPPMFGRKPMRHEFVNAGHRGVDDYYDQFYPQSSSQWDALSHIPHPDHGFYNGRTIDEVRPAAGNKNGIHNAARHGIAGRFVLADVERYRRKVGRPIFNDGSDKIDVDDLEATLADEKVEVGAGDILLVRCGWIEWYDNLANDELRSELATQAIPPSPGLKQEPDMARWLWDRHVAAVAADNPGLEAMPFEYEVGAFLHYDLISLLGITIGELFALGDLASDCASDGIYEGLLVAAPLNKLGGIGSPANAVALK